MRTYDSLLGAILFFLPSPWSSSYFKGAGSPKVGGRGRQKVLGREVGERPGGGGRNHIIYIVVTIYDMT